MASIILMVSMNKLGRLRVVGILSVIHHSLSGWHRDGFRVLKLVLMVLLSDRRPHIAAK